MTRLVAGIPVPLPEFQATDELFFMTRDAITPEEAAALHDHAVIGGYGLPGRAVVEHVVGRGIPYCVVELNPDVVHRCERVVPIIAGDITDEQTLRRAGVERCAMVALTVPSDVAVLQAITLVRKINPRVPIMARCRFISSGMEAHRRGATQVIVEEQSVANDFLRVLREPTSRKPTDPT